ncbi:MAG TPA: phosphatidate cytidylyltransferase [Anaerolineaceae bacterium]|nr:phosphatidate cytidylyltransferase [Anaerolineaceae bacterium]
MDFLAHRGIISGGLSRKIIHIGTGPIFVLCWLLFNNRIEARFLAALVPLGITLQFLLVGTGIIKDPSAVQAMSRSGQRSEILRGPLFYGIVFVALTIGFWKENPVGVVALMILCGGDGLADIIGKRFKSGRLRWSPQKSWAGTFSVFVGGWIFAVVVLAIMLTAKAFPGTLTGLLPGITVIAFISAVVESLPFSDIDNLTVPLTAVLLGIVLF